MSELDNVSHITPPDGLRHIEDGARCWCFPVIGRCPEGHIYYIHNAFSVDKPPVGDTAKWH